jgi:hypothetical protein
MLFPKAIFKGRSRPTPRYARRWRPSGSDCGRSGRPNSVQVNECPCDKARLWFPPYAQPDAEAVETSAPAIIAAAESRMKAEIPRD